MKSYILLLLSILISTGYTILAFFSVISFERNGIFNSFILHMGAGHFLTGTIVVCLLVNIMLTFLLVKKNWQKTVSYFLYASFICGSLLIFVIGKNQVIGNFLYNTFINLFYHGVRYSSEDAPLQLITYIPRVMTLAFFIGFILAYVFVVAKKIKLCNARH